VDGDLSEAVLALKAAFEKRFIPANFRPSEDANVGTLTRSLELTDRYAAFLKAADPIDVETATPPERVRFIPSAELEQEQNGYSRGDDDNPQRNGWRRGWVVIAHSAMLGDPYFLDTHKPDREGDCPVMTAMSGTSHINPVLCASSFASFVQILATAMEIAEDFKETGDPDDEHIFREALGTKLRVIDPVALKEGHWTN
jgi:hypothetical protein